MLQCILAWTSRTCGLKTAFFVVAYHQQHHTAMTAMHNCTSQGIIFSLAKHEVNLKKRPERRAVCSKAEPKISHRRRPLPEGAGRPKFNQLRCSLSFYHQAEFGEDRCTQFRVIMVTGPQTHAPTHPQTNRHDRLKYTSPQLR